MIDNNVVRAKAEAAEEMSVASGMRYIMYAGNTLMKQNVLDDSFNYDDQFITFEE